MRIIPLSSTTVMKTLEKLGYFMNNSKGSHRIFAHQSKAQQVTVPNHKELQTGTIRNIIKQTGLSVDSFYSYI